MTATVTEIAQHFVTSDDGVVSGPSADHLANYVLGKPKRPYQPKLFLCGLSQLLRLTYQIAFSVPVIPGVLIRASGPTRWQSHRVGGREGQADSPVTAEAYIVYGVAHVLPQAMRFSARGRMF